MYIARVCLSSRFYIRAYFIPHLNTLHFYVSYVCIGTWIFCCIVFYRHLFRLEWKLKKHICLKLYKASITIIYCCASMDWNMSRKRIMFAKDVKRICLDLSGWLQNHYTTQYLKVNESHEGIYAWNKPFKCVISIADLQI